jgi:hypothetical protein
MTSATPVDGAQPADGEDKTMAIRPYTSPTWGGKTTPCANASDIG